MGEIDAEIANWQLAGVRGQRVLVGLPSREMSPLEALVHAAYLVSMAEMAAMISHEELPAFDKVLKMIQGDNK